MHARGSFEVAQRARLVFERAGIDDHAPSGGCPLEGEDIAVAVRRQMIRRDRTAIGDDEAVALTRAEIAGIAEGEQLAGGRAIACSDLFVSGQAVRSGVGHVHAAVVEQTGACVGMSEVGRDPGHGIERRL